MDGVKDVAARLNTHEMVCAERYAGINARLRRIEGWFFAATASTLGLMATIILKVLP